jgi:uncharacterized protein involved in response to NO
VIKANGLACCRHESYSASQALSRSCPALLWLSAVLFFGAAYAALAIGVWLPLFEGEIAIPTLFSSPDWHVHEMLFGYVPAIVTGFLLTAIPNWTGRLPLQGIPLLILVVAWGAGRAVVTCSAYLGWLSAAVIDTTFLLLVIGAAGREIIAGRNWRNLKVLIPLTVLGVANAAFHLEAHVFGLTEYAARIAITAILALLMLIGGRIVPSFTRNWLARENPGRLPLPFGKFDAAAIAVSTAALCLWILAPTGVVPAAALFLAGILQIIRLARWAGERTAREPLVLILHVAYAFVPAGFILMSLAALSAVRPGAGLHAWMAGAVGTMTLAVMTRASLGHTGRQLAATAGTQAIYAAVVLAALIRVGAALFTTWNVMLLHLAALAWVAVFGGFALLYAPILFLPRK